MTDPRPYRPASLPGFSSPAVGFDEPMEMLHACHDRVRRSLNLLRRLGERVSEGRLDDAVYSAAADVVRYFDLAAPHHHQDEERHIFPLLLSQCADPALREAVLRLQEDHRSMESQWASLRTALTALAGGHGEAFGAEQIDAATRFRELYERHTQTEEALVFPAACALADEQTLQAMGQEMAGRRRASPALPRG